MYKTPGNLEELKTIASSTAIAIFGAGTNGRRVCGALRKVGMAPICYLDNFKSGIEEKYGLPILAPGDFIRDNSNCLILLGLMSKGSSQGVIAQLGGMVSPERVLCYEEVVRMFEGMEFTWADSRESEYDFHANDRDIELLAKWIDDEDGSVADLGCGKSQHLRTLLRPHCKYLPFDYVSRSADTQVCDFNGPSLPHLKVDVAFICGVLSQVRDVSRFLSWACDGSANKIIIRHRIYDKQPMYSRFLGYVSTPSTDEVERIAAARGFVRKLKDTYFRGDTEFVSMCFERDNGQ
jgi:hypothetical protein